MKTLSKLQAKPFLKWAGGKTALLPILEHYYPEKIEYYHEPFIGGGALFFHLRDRIQNAYISDINDELIITYREIQNNVDDLIDTLARLSRQHNESNYYKIRKSKPWRPLDVAARFIYLNKTCFNGLYRVNSKGEFNVPIGRTSTGKKPSILDESNLRAAHDALQGVHIINQPFHLTNAAAGHYVYMDPPYYPLDENSFTKYNKRDFGQQEQQQLFDFMCALDKRKVNVLQSNSGAAWIEQTYKDFQLVPVSVKRSINSSAEGRGKVKEFLISNYLSRT